MKIVFVDYVLDPSKPGRSGLSDMVWDMSSELVNQGHDVHVVASYHTHTYPDPRVTVHNFPTPPIGYRNIIGQLWILARAAHIIRTLKPDVIHAPEYVSTAVMTALRVGAPTVLTVPGNIYHRLSRNDGFKSEWSYTLVLKWAARTSARHCAKVIAISQDMKHWWEWTGSQPENTPMIPLGTDPARFYHVQDARRTLGLPLEPLTLLYVGRFATEKGLFDVLGAVERLKRRDPHLASRLRVHLIGRGTLETALREHCERHDLTDVVHIREWVDPEALSTWYSAADAMILASSSEGFSRTIPEAMSCGTPVLGTRISGTEDHVKDGINGYLFPWGQPDVLADLIADLLRRPCTLRDMRASTQTYAREHLQWPGIMQEIVQRVYIPVQQHWVGE